MVINIFENGENAGDVRGKINTNFTDLVTGLNSLSSRTVGVEVDVSSLSTRMVSVEVGKVATTTTVNGHALSSNVTVTATDVGLGNVSNLSPANLPISTASQSALDLKANASDVIGLLDLKGSLDASGNPNYSTALKGDSYVVTVAGKVGGSSGKVVEVGDMVLALADNAGGAEASVGTSWTVLQSNITGITSAGLTLVQAADAAAQRSALSLVPGTDVQVFRGELVKIGSQGTDIASGSTVNIGAATGDEVNITGTTGITAFDTVAAGVRRFLKFAGILTITHNGTSLILPAGRNIVTAAGDIAQFKSLGSGNWQLEGYLRASGLPVVLDQSPVSLTYGASMTPALSDGAYRKTTLTGNGTLNAPSGTPYDGQRWRGRFTADASARDLTLNAAIKVPTASTFTGTKTITASEMWLVQIEYSSDLSAWVLQSLVGGWI